MNDKQLEEFEAFKERIAILSGAFFLFGLAGLFMIDGVWPGILPLIGLTAIPILWTETGWRMTLWLVVQMAIWLGGLPLLFAADFFFPGVLILAGLSTLVVAIAQPDDLEERHKEWLRERYSAEGSKPKRKAKRVAAIPVPPDADHASPDDDWIEDEDDLEAEAGYAETDQDVDPGEISDHRGGGA
jgi:hypothetical protein